MMLAWNLYVVMMLAWNLYLKQLKSTIGPNRDCEAMSRSPTR
jgi:hypothetical protein